MMIRRIAVRVAMSTVRIGALRTHLFQQLPRETHYSSWRKTRSDRIIRYSRRFVRCADQIEPPSLFRLLPTLLFRLRTMK